MLGCEGDQLITGKCPECLERPQWIFHKRRVWVSVVVLPWFYCDEFSRPCQFSWTPLLLSVKTCLPQVYYWVTQVNWRAHQARQKLSRSLSWRIINSLIWEFVTNSSWSVRGCEVSRRDHLFWSKLSSNMVRMTVQLWYRPINKMYHQRIASTTLKHSVTLRLSLLLLLEIWFCQKINFQE